MTSTLIPTALVLSLACTAVSTADQQIIQIPASSSGMLHASNCCTMSYMGSANASTVFMRTCQSVYMSCIGSRRAAVWQFDLSGIPDDATLVSARFKGTRPEVYMTGSGFLSLKFDTGALSSSVCLSLWNGGSWQTSYNWPYGHDFNASVTAGMNQQFGTASTVSILGYSGGTSAVSITNTGADAPILELTVDVPDLLPCAGDLNGDRVVDGVDISLILGYWGREFPKYDLDGSGVIDGADLATVLGWWGACAD